MSVASLYEPLDVDSHEIRLLSILPGQPDSVVQCELKRANLMRVHDFSALSYSWGNEKQTRDIIVNGIHVPVTHNLADALHRLRELNVTSLWADAICINQSDKAERSSQVRIMKEIYSRAGAAYAWLGHRHNEAAVTLMQVFAGTREPPRNAFAKAQLKVAKIVSKGRSPSSRSEYELSTRPSSETLSTEDGFDILSNFLEQEYWKRRWIIQEITAAFKVYILYGSETLSISELDTALDLCRRSSYWRPVHESGSRYLSRVLRIRRAYHAGNTFDICRAIVETQDSKSKDPRDNLFALIGICHDGPGLVPLPNYSQSPGDIARDFTRELLRRHVCFDVILLAPRSISPSLQAPSWAPDWLSGTLPESASTIPYRMPALGYQFALDSLRTGPDALIVHGVMLGTIVDLTSVIGSANPMPTTIQQTEALTGYPTRPKTHYYGHRTASLADALIRCLLHTHFVSGIYYKHSRMMNCFYRALKRPLFKQSSYAPCNEQHLDPGDTFAGWLHANHHFVLNGTPLDDFFRSYILSAWRWATLQYLCLLLLAPAGPALLVAGIVLDRSGKSDLATLILLIGVILTLFGLGWYWPGLYFLTRKKSKMNTDVLRALQQDRKLAITDQGMLAMTCPNSEVGDKICFIAGCSSAVILRRAVWAEEEQYYVVGKAFANLSKGDIKKFELFAYDHYRPSGDSFSADKDSPTQKRSREDRNRENKRQKRRNEFTKLVAKYKSKEWWREFVLI